MSESNSRSRTSMAGSTGLWLSLGPSSGAPTVLCDDDIDRRACEGLLARGAARPLGAGESQAHRGVLARPALKH
jgi:hypothetical protein